MPVSVTPLFKANGMVCNIVNFNFDFIILFFKKRIVLD